MALLQSTGASSTFLSYSSLPEAFCSFRICCQQLECLQICWNKGPCGANLEQLQSLPFIWTLLMFDTIADTLFRAVRAYVQVTTKTTKAQQTFACILVIGRARWSNLSFTQRGLLDLQKLHWGIRSLNFHKFYLFPFDLHVSYQGS